MKKRAEHEFGYAHEYYKDPMNWRLGEGISLSDRKAAGDPKAFRTKLRDKIMELQEKKEPDE